MKKSEMYDIRVYYDCLKMGFISKRLDNLDFSKIKVEDGDEWNRRVVVLIMQELDFTEMCFVCHTLIEMGEINKIFQDSKLVSYGSNKATFMVFYLDGLGDRMLPLINPLKDGF